MWILRPLMAGLGLVGVAAVVAFAQTPATAPRAQSQFVGVDQMQDGPPLMPHWIHSHELPPGMPFPPPPKGAFFHLQRGDAQIAVKCADDEPTKACIEAVSQLLDKVTASH
jgi:hypothetical protein